MRVGDRWSYDVKDGLTGDLRNQITVVTVDVNEKEITTRVTRKGKPPITVVYDPHWGLIDNSNTKHKPNQIGMKLPLQVGKQWRSEWTTTKIESGNVFRANASAKVAGQETVTTPAGKFDAFKVEIAVREINTRDQTKSSTVQQTVWYAPGVGRWVKKSTEVRFEGRVRESVTEELTDFSRKS